MALTTDLAPIREARAAAELAGWRVVEAGGSDARRWLHDLLTADVVDLRPGEARRALLLAPTGHLRADVTVAHVGESLLLVQDPRQPPVDHLLARYVLSADVRLEDRSADVRIIAVPNRPLPRGARGYAPSAAGPGHDLVLAAGEGGRPQGSVTVAPDALEAWRIARGEARFPQDLTERSIPNEAGLEALIDVEKGCFLGQEAVARTRNLGHPPFVLVAGRAGGTASPGDAVLAEGEEVGTVTSAADLADTTPIIARVRWSARAAPLSLPSGAAIEVSGLASGAA